MTFRIFRLTIHAALMILSLIIMADVAAQDKKQEADAGKQVEAKKEPEKKAPAPKQVPDPKPNQEKKNIELLDVEMTDIHGKKVNLKKYKGKVVLIVNVASKCGFTGQYKPLQALHKQYRQHGLEVAAFPCNQFGKQEPANEPAINAFCTKKFGIEFDLFSKVDVKGEKQCELFKRLTQVNLAPAGKGDIYWNFEKFLIARDGKPIARFRSNVAPDNKALVSKLKTALGIKEGKAEPKEQAHEKDTSKPDSKPKPQDNDGKKEEAEPKKDKKS
jgi:glutathione peroxidase